MTSKFRTVAAVLVAALWLAGCAWTPHSINLQPEVQVAESSVGAGTRLFMRFIDERDDTNVGHRSVATVGAKISAENLPSTVEAKLREGLTKKGYTLVPSEQGADATATFRLRAFKFYIEQGFWTGGENASAVLAVDGRRGSKDFTSVYRYRDEKRIGAIPDGKGIDEHMNKALSDILQQALADGALDLFLSGKGVTSDADEQIGVWQLASSGAGFLQ